MHGGTKKGGCQNYCDTGPGSDDKLTTAETVLLGGLRPVTVMSKTGGPGSELITAEMVLLGGLVKGLVPQTVMSKAGQDQNLMN